MIAYKFLRAGRIGPFSKFAWPEPGVWVRAGAATDQCRRGIHACRTRDLPWWLADELWEIELDGEPQIDEHKLVAPAGALRSQIDGWTAACAQELRRSLRMAGAGQGLEALNRAGHSHAADQLAACTTLDDLLVTARRLADDVPDTRISLTMAGDGAVRALTGAPPTSAYIAAHAALRLDGPSGYAAERAWQSRWLVRAARQLQRPEYARSLTDCSSSSIRNSFHASVRIQRRP